MASGQRSSTDQSRAESLINEEEFDIDVVAYRSFQQIFGPRGLAILEQILECWTEESPVETHDRFVKMLERQPSGRITEVHDYVTIRVR